MLEGLTVNKSGKIIDANGTTVGELVEGDARKLSKSGISADAEGQFWDNKGHVIGRAKTLPAEDPEEEGAFAGLEGLIVNKDGYVEDENGNIVGVVVEGNAKKLVGRAVDEEGDIIDKRGSVVGRDDRIFDPVQLACWSLCRTICAVRSNISFRATLEPFSSTVGSPSSLGVTDTNSSTPVLPKITGIVPTMIILVGSKVTSVNFI